MTARRVTLRLLLIITLSGAFAACGRTGMDGTGGVDPDPTGTAQPTATATAAAAPVMPVAVTAEHVYSAPQRGYVSPLAHGNLPKLAADANWLYAAHAHLNTSSDNRYVALMRKRRNAPAGAPWELAATLARPSDQPAGIVMDAQDRLHLVFQCVRDQGGVIDISIGGGGDECFAGYDAGSQGRAWHVVFSQRSGDALRFDASQGDIAETIGGDRGELGIGVVDSRVWWTGLDSSGTRRARAWDSPTNWSDVAFPAPPKTSIVTLEPLVGRSMTAGDSLILTAEWDNALDSIVASAGMKSMQNQLTEVVRRDASGAEPIDMAFEPNGTLVVLSSEDSQTALLRYDGGVGVMPVEIPIDASEGAELQINRAGHWYVIDTTLGGSEICIQASSDRGATWVHQDVPLSGLPSNGDNVYGDFVALEPHSAANAYDPDRFVFLFTGWADVAGYRSTYLGSFDLK